MTRNQTNRKEMQEDVLTYLNTNVQKWNSIPIIGNIKNELNEVNSGIDTKLKEQTEARVFMGKNKAQLKRIIAEKADILNDQVETYASLNGDLALEAKMRASMSDLINLKNEQFVVKIQEVVTEVEHHLEPLSAEYGVHEGQVTDLKNDLDTFMDMQGMPRAYQISSVMATKSLDELFKQAHDVLQKLDKVMKIFKRRDANFYNGYMAARVVVDN
ncbi:MAG: hypothetical protein JEZ14_21920 [Marinilabiliaceae bacterium]|nr:hypothetical protein [Marinilabiliaceae bacterium]